MGGPCADVCRWTNGRRSNDQHARGRGKGWRTGKHGVAAGERAVLGCLSASTSYPDDVGWRLHGDHLGLGFTVGDAVGDRVARAAVNSVSAMNSRRPAGRKVAPPESRRSADQLRRGLERDLVASCAAAWPGRT